MHAAGGPPDVSAWPGIELVRPLTGGARNPVFLARCGSQYFVVRRSGRSVESLDWEFDLLEFLEAAGLGAPRRVPTADGRRHDRFIVVERFVGGTPPRSRRDRKRVIGMLAAVHDATTGRPQRPGFASAQDLMTSPSGGDVRLDTMPADAVAAVRGAWRPLTSSRQAVVHGDPGPSNVVMAGDTPVLIDWDEARVDAEAFDFTDFDDDVVPCGFDRETLRTAGIAWEAATCWTSEPEYAAERLAELLRRP